MIYHADEFNITISKLLFHDQLMKITNKPLDNRGLFSALIKTFLAVVL